DRGAFVRPRPCVVPRRQHPVRGTEGAGRRCPGQDDGGRARLRPFRAMMIARPTAQFTFSHPAHFIALGFGAGLSRFAPGTAGTLAAFPVWWLMGGGDEPLALFAILAALFLVGVWACERTGRDLGVADHGAMCWDEI